MVGEWRGLYHGTRGVGPWLWLGLQLLQPPHVSTNIGSRDRTRQPTRVVDCGQARASRVRRSQEAGGDRLKGQKSRLTLLPRISPMFRLGRAIRHPWDVAVIILIRSQVSPGTMRDRVGRKGPRCPSAVEGGLQLSIVGSAKRTKVGHALMVLCQRQRQPPSASDARANFHVWRRTQTVARRARRPHSATKGADTKYRLGTCIEHHPHRIHIG